MGYRNPIPTVDVIIEIGARIVLIERANAPLGWALPGGFVDEGERLEVAARREAMEETRLDVALTHLLYVYSAPDRDPRQHTVSTVFIGQATGEPTAGDDAARIALVDPAAPGVPLAFDHAQILADYVRFKATGKRPLEG